MTVLGLIVIIVGIWGCIHLVGNIIIEIAEIKVNANPLNKLFKNNENKEKEGK